MALTVTTPSAAPELCELQKVKDELGITSDSDDDVLTELIKDASLILEEYCQRTFAEQTYRETLPGYGGTNMVLSVIPIVSITQILRDTSAITDFTITEPESGIIWRQAGWGWTTQFVGNSLVAHPFPGSEKYEYQVDYVAGFKVFNAVVPNLPRGVERAAIITVKDWFNNLAVNTTIKKFKSADTAIEQVIEAIPPSALRLVSPFRITE